VGIIPCATLVTFTLLVNITLVSLWPLIPGQAGIQQDIFIRLGIVGRQDDQVGVDDARECPVRFTTRRLTWFA